MGPTKQTIGTQTAEICHADVLAAEVLLMLSSSTGRVLLTAPSADAEMPSASTFSVALPLGKRKKERSEAQQRAIRHAKSIAIQERGKTHISRTDCLRIATIKTFAKELQEKPVVGGTVTLRPTDEQLVAFVKTALDMRVRDEQILPSVAEDAAEKMRRLLNVRCEKGIKAAHKFYTVECSELFHLFSHHMGSAGILVKRLTGGPKLLNQEWVVHLDKIYIKNRDSWTKGTTVPEVGIYSQSRYAGFNHLLLAADASVPVADLLLQGSAAAVDQCNQATF